MVKSSSQRTGKLSNQIPTVPVSGDGISDTEKSTVPNLSTDPEIGSSILISNKFSSLPVESTTDITTLKSHQMTNFKSNTSLNFNSDQVPVKSNQMKEIKSSNSNTMMLQHVISPHFKASKENNSIDVRKPPKLKSHTKNHVFGFNQTASGKSILKSKEKPGDRPLNINLKQDRSTLVKLKRNLETLQQIAKDRRSNGDQADPFKVYKELPGSVVNLYLTEDILIRPINQMLVTLKPKYKDQLKDKLWLAHPYKNTKNHVDFQNHPQICIIPTICDKTVTYKRSVCIRNNSHEVVRLSAGTLLCQAKELYYSSLPVMDSTIVAEIDQLEEPVQTAADKELNESPKQKAEREFKEDILNYKHPDERAVIEEFPEVFVPTHDYLLDKINMPPIKLGTKSPEIKPTPPPGRRHFSERHDEAISTWLEVGLMNGLISRTQSDTVSPLHCVEQKDKLRIVMDSRKVNEQLSLYNYVFPKISDDIEELSSGRFKMFGQTDLTGAFNQIEIHEDSRFLLAFGVHTKKYRGVFAYNRLPFGIKSAPSIFASVLDHALQKINDGSNGKYMIKSFIDDIVIGAVDRKWMIVALRKLFGVLSYFNFKLSLPKSKFFVPAVDYCGIEINENGYCISEKRKKILRDYPDFDVRSRKKNADLSHLGFYNWHRRFVKDYSINDRKIRDTIRAFKDKSIDASTANTIIKEVTDHMKDQILSTMLITPTNEDEITLQCDASGKSWGYVCYCDRGVLAYGGGSFSDTVVRSHNIFEKEAKGMSNSLSDAYKLISQGKSLVIKNDNLSLIKVNKTNKTIVTPRIIKYMQNIAMIAQELPTNFVHLNTHENYMADVLSRLEYDENGTIKLCALNSDAVDLSGNETSFLSIQEKPKLNNDRRELLEYYRRLHRNFHWSVAKTIKSLPVYGIPLDKELVVEAWLECPHCGSSKKAAPVSKLKFREAPDLPMDEIHVDHVIKKEGQKSIFGHEAAVTLKCGLTRYFVCFPMKNVQIRATLDNLQNFFMAVGRKPKKIYADNAFDTVNMHLFCSRHDIDISFRPSRMSRSVSVESTHRRLHEKVASLLGKKRHSSWHEVLWEAVMAINCQPHDSTGFTPYYLFHGHHPQRLGTCEIPTNQIDDEFWAYDLKIAKTISDEARMKTSSNYDFPKFLPGQRIQIKSDNSKFSSHYEGEIVEDQGGATAMVKLDNRKRPLLFHKGHIYAKKYSDAWKLLNKTTRDFTEMQSVPVEKEEITEPVAKRTRSKQNGVLASIKSLLDMQGQA